MDFMIIAPDHIMRVDQKGWFHREYTVINTTMIKSINIEKDGIWRSVFDYRTVCIRAGGEGEEDTMIHMRFVNNPEAIRVFISQKKYRGLL
ncbi:MAG: PH domain-containing protein [Candidatus Absconditabacterales bacterium]|nr:PH domain-containing protein [Candidatus Absconditabacterales bacterium]